MCVIFKVKHVSPPKSICFRDYGETNAQNVAATFDNDLICCTLPNSNPNEDADYTVNLVKRLLNN